MTQILKKTTRMRIKERMQKKLQISSVMKFAVAMFFVAMLTWALPTNASAQGNLLITPRRVVFEGAIKTQELNLANTGKDTARYNVSIIQYRMKEDGSFEEITQPDPGQNFADKNIRFFPRSVTLAPNEAQVVKMQLTKTSDLKPGEYRSHVYFRAVPKERALGEEDTRKDSTGISVQLVPIFGITIPVIIRVGQSTTKVNLSDLNVEMANDTLSRLKLTFNRSGNMSVYGDILVTYISPEGKSTEVGVVKGIAVYTPNTVRRFQLDLKNLPDIDYHKGKLNVVYSSQSDSKSEIFAQSVLDLK
jgi:P pilus assembly chaperone PapD